MKGTDQKITIIGIPTELGNPDHWETVAYAPPYFRKKGLSDFLKYELEFVDVSDMGDVDCEPGIEAADAFEEDSGTDPALLKRIIEVPEATAGKVYDTIIKAESKVLAIGGGSFYVLRYCIRGSCGCKKKI